jgi:hypothetical protein
MSAPRAEPDDKEIDLEIARCFPLAKDFKDTLLGIFVFQRRTLRAFESADYVFSIVILSERGKFIRNFHLQLAALPGDSKGRIQARF